MSILNQILAVKKDEVKKLHANFRLRHFYDSEFSDRPVKGLHSALTAFSYPAIIAEIKKASPSAGVIRADFDPEKFAHLYEDNGATAISVLTDTHFFQGDIGFLSTIARFCEVPLLRKDFIIDVYQVFESRWAGADAVLLIAEILSGNQIDELSHAAREAGLEILMEVHDKAQLQKIDLTRKRIIGINNRNLNDFSVDLNTSISVKQNLPGHITTVAESGVKRKQDVAIIRRAAIDGILIGEHLMRSEDPGFALRELITWCRNES